MQPCVRNGNETTTMPRSRLGELSPAALSLCLKVVATLQPWKAWFILPVGQSHGVLRPGGEVTWLSSRAFAPLLPSRIAGTLTFSALRGSHRKAVQKQRNATPVPIHQRGCVAPPCCQATRRRQSMKRVFSEWPAMVAGRKSYGKCRIIRF